MEETKKKTVYEMLKEISDLLTESLSIVKEYEKTVDMEKIQKILKIAVNPVTTILEDVKTEVNTIIEDERIQKRYKDFPEVYEKCKDMMEDVEKQLKASVYILQVYKYYEIVENTTNLDFLKVNSQLEVLVDKVNKNNEKIKTIIPNSKK